MNALRFCGSAAPSAERLCLSDRDMMWGCAPNAALGPHLAQIKGVALHFPSDGKASLSALGAAEPLHTGEKYFWRVGTTRDCVRSG